MYKSILLVAVSLAFFSHLSSAQTSQNPELVTKAWIGVATAEVPKTLREYLELKEGFGIQITHIPADSPAAGAGLKPGDVLTKFNDQLLTSPIHLAILVRAQEKGDSIELTYLRKGAEKTVSIVLSEKEVRPLAAIRSIGNGPRQSRNVSELISRYYGGADKVPSHYLSSRSTPKVSKNCIVKIDNENGEVRLHTAEGQRVIEIKDAAGVVIHQGAFDEAKGFEGLPMEAREHLKLMKFDNLDELLLKIETKVK